LPRGYRSVTFGRFAKIVQAAALRRPGAGKARASPGGFFGLAADRAIGVASGSYAA